jgi:U3 small nucleolar RNA-associated protein 18
MQAAGLESLIFSRDDAALEDLGHEGDALFGLGDALGAARADAPGAAAAPPLAAFEDRGGAAPARRSAWEDPADAAVQVEISALPRLRKLREVEGEGAVGGGEYQRRLRAQHAKLNPRTSWADAASRDPEAVTQLTSRAGGLLAAPRALPPGQLETTRLKDANQQEASQSVVSSVEFHPNGQLLLAAGLDRRLRFFNVDGASNPRVQSVFLEDMPVRQAAFAAGGAQVLAAGRRRFFYVLDLESAKVERVAGLFGREERSLEAFAASTSAPGAPAAGRPASVGGGGGGGTRPA